MEMTHSRQLNLPHYQTYQNPVHENLVSTWQSGRMWGLVTDICEAIIEDNNCSYQAPV